MLWLLYILLVYLDNDTEKASLVTITDGSTDLIGANALSMVTDKIILEHQAGTEITNANLDVIAGVDPENDDGITVTGGDATFASGREVWVSSGNNYNPGGDVILSDIEIFGTLTGGANTFTVNGNWNNNGGAFTAGTSIVIFATSAAANIAGNTTFNNVTCTTVSKSIIVAQGSTQTVSGKFLLDGDAFATRISLASSGGSGKTWNLVLNGTHDCRYVAVQGSTASTTPSGAYLPVNPVGFKDNGDNTNWYDPSLPPEMLFYDDFETSTLASAPPDKTSSYWDISTAGWLTQASTVKDNQNHTSGGSQSMYSSGGASGQGVGAWNSPSWGPQTNCTAEAWFYDDMQNTKMQFIFLDNAAGNQGVGVLVETNAGDGLTKYRYSRFGFGGGTIYENSFIDRTLGWHKVKWVHTEGTVELFLDGALLMTASGLSDFSAFDTGSWTWHNSTGSTPMWFDDFVVYRSQHQSSYEWFDNSSAQSPASLSGNVENTPISRDINTTTRLRIQIQNDQNEDWSGEYIGMQYREGSNGTWTMLGASSDWNYADGLGIDKSTLTTSLLTNTDVLQSFVETIPSAASINMTNSQYGEWDFTVVPTTHATIGATYYLIPVITDSSGNFIRYLAAYAEVAECQVTSSTMWAWLGTVDSNWSNPANWASGTVPTATSDVIIQNGASNPCRIDIAGAVCSSLLVQDSMSLLLDSTSTDLTVANNITVYGSVTHSDNTATLNLTSGTLRIEGATAEYNHSGNGAINAANATIQVINGGSYNVSGAPTIIVNTLDMSVGGVIDVTGAAIFNVDDFAIELNGQWLSSNIGNTVNIANDFINNGSMLGSTGGVFDFDGGVGTTLAGSSTTTTMYQANFNDTTTVTMTETIVVLDDLIIANSATLTASTGIIKVGGDWTNSGTFTHGGGTIELNGTALQEVTAAGSDFYNLVQTNGSVAGVSFLDDLTTFTLTNSTPASTMTFNAGSTYTINSASGVQLAGTAGNEIILQSSTPGTFWHINPAGGAWSVDYVNVTDSVNIAELTIFPTNSTGSLQHNINWFSSDQDNDELPDYWEYKYYSGLLKPLINDAESDTETPTPDGLSNLEEYVLDTDPTVPNVNIGQVLFVDDNAGYIGTGTVTEPFKYLEHALDAASDGTLISLAPGTYELDDYDLDKRVVIRGAQGAVKTIIHGTTPNSGTAEDGQLLNVIGKQFMISNITLRMFRDDKPIITYNGGGSVKVIVFENLIFRDNDTQTKSLIAPTGTNGPKDLYMINCLFYNNSALSAAELKGDKWMKAYNNTIVNNTFGSGLIISSKKESWLTNNILRNSITEITNISTGPLTVSNCNFDDYVDDSTPLTSINCYNSPEIFANSATGAYQLLPGSPGVGVGLLTALDWDINDNPRVGAFDVGAYQLDPNDDDGDGLANASDPDSTNPDTDGDGMTDGEEVSYGTNPLLKNTDGDFIDDGYERPMGMDPKVIDGNGDIDGVYATSFENSGQFPEGDLTDTIWGPDGNSKKNDPDLLVRNSLVIKGVVEIKDVGVAAYPDGGTHVARAVGAPPGFGGLVESSMIGWVDKGGLGDYWLTVAFKCPGVKLPTDLNEAFNLGGSFFALDENRYLNIWDPSTETWLKDTQVTPDDWFVITVHRYHNTGIVDFYIETRPVRSGIPISSPDPSEKFRISFSSVGEQDVFFDAFSALPFKPF